jgi:hypothetical protein
MVDLFDAFRKVFPWYCSPGSILHVRMFLVVQFCMYEYKKNLGMFYQLNNSLHLARLDNSFVINVIELIFVDISYSPTENSSDSC